VIFAFFSIETTPIGRNPTWLPSASSLHVLAEDLSWFVGHAMHQGRFAFFPSSPLIASAYLTDVVLASRREGRDGLGNSRTPPCGPSGTTTGEETLLTERTRVATRVSVRGMVAAA
jgi:hypothetical protein